MKKKHRRLKSIKARNVSIIKDSEITLFIKVWMKVLSHPTPKLPLSGEEMQVSEQRGDGTGRVTTQDDLPQNQNSVVPGDDTAANNSRQPQTHISVKNQALRSVLSGQSGSCLYQWVGTQRLWEHDREGGWMGGGGGAKGEPWLMKWLRFSKPWPAPCSLPNNPVTAGPSHKASIVLLACHSPHQTHNTHTLLLLISIPASKPGTPQPVCGEMK